jgi:quinol monooxygenase YgiN
MILILQHTVRDYDTWRPLFDEHEGVRAKYGCLGHTVFRAADQPNDLTLLLRWESRERAEQFLHDPSLAETMQRGGVIGEPRTTWVEKADTVTYAERRAA